MKNIEKACILGSVVVFTFMFLFHSVSTFEDWKESKDIEVKLLEYGCTSPIDCYVDFEYNVLAKSISVSKSKWEWEFYNELYEKKNIKNIKFYQKVKVSKEVIDKPVYDKCEIKPVGNQSFKPYFEDCIIGYFYKKIEVEEWKEIDYYKTNLNKGKHLIRVEIIRKPNEKIDFIPKIDGQKIYEWAWWNTSWHYKKEINITGGSSALTNFKAYAIINFSIVDNLWANANTSIRFLNSSEGSTLDFDWEYINSTSAGVWILFPTLNTGNNTIYMYYNSSGAVDGSSSATWIDDIVRYKMEDKVATKEVKDSSITEFNATSSVNTIGLSKLTSPFGSGLYFNATEIVYNLNDTMELQINTTLNDNFTINLWAKSANTYWRDNAHQTFLKIHKDDNNYVRINFANYTPIGLPPHGGDMVFQYIGNGKLRELRTFDTVNTTTWHMYTLARKNATDINVYVDGIDIGEINDTGIFIGPTINLTIGGNIEMPLNDLSNFTFDHYSISNTSYSANYIKRIYNNSNSIFYYFGTELPIPVTNVTLNSPVNYYNSSSSSIDFNCSAIDSMSNVTNITIEIRYLNNTLINSSVDKNNSLSVTRVFHMVSLPDGENHKWNCIAYNNISTYSSGIERYFSVDISPPSISINYPINNSDIKQPSFPMNISLDCTITDSNLDVCWYAVDGGTNTTLANCNVSSFSISTSGNHNVTVWANDSNSLVGNTIHFFDVSTGSSGGGPGGSNGDQNGDEDGNYENPNVPPADNAQDNNNDGDYMDPYDDYDGDGIYNIEDPTPWGHIITLPTGGAGGGGSGCREFVMAIALIRPDSDTRIYRDIERTLLYTWMREYTIDNNIATSYTMTTEDLDNMRAWFKSEKAYSFTNTQLFGWLNNYFKRSVDSVEVCKADALRLGLYTDIVITEGKTFYTIPEMLDAIFWASEFFTKDTDDFEYSVRATKALASCEVREGPFECELVYVDNVSDSFLVTFEAQRDWRPFKVITGIIRLESLFGEIYYADVYITIINPTTFIPLIIILIITALGIYIAFKKKGKKGKKASKFDFKKLIYIKK